MSGVSLGPVRDAQVGDGDVVQETPNPLDVPYGVCRLHFLRGPTHAARERYRSVAHVHPHSFRNTPVEGTPGIGEDFRVVAVS